MRPLTVQARIASLAVLLVLILGLLTGILVVGQLGGEMERSLHDRGHILAHSIAGLIAESVINGEVISTEDVLEHAVKEEGEARFALVTDFDGNLFAHTFLRDVPPGLPLPQKPLTGSNDWSAHGSYGGKRIYSVGAPLIEGMRGTVVVGMDEDLVRRGIMQAAVRIMALILAMAVLGAGAGIVFARRIARPLVRLSRSIGTFGKGEDPGELSLVEGGLEIRDLGEAFNRMREERRRMDSRIHAALEEKETLFREMNHRVKNNLQVISSLLNLQARSSGDESTVLALRESQNRVLSIALLHEKLYRAENLGLVEFDLYLKDLSSHLAASFGAENRVAVRLEGEKISLESSLAVSCGLVMNELLSNAFKYAFPGDRKGEIQVTLTRLDEEHCRMVVRDDGVGIPPALDVARSGTLGLQLVHSLVGQMGGTVALCRSSPGTVWTIDFPCTPPPQAAG